ncbi:MAG: hypothetical protein RI826_10015, partial [Chlorobium phaeovibrioides]|nr:hypothetical protein [Chlorobium phaeovibrioides]
MAATHGGQPWGPHELASDVIRAQATLQLAQGNSFHAAYRTIASTTQAQLEHAQGVIATLQATVVKLATQVAETAQAAMKHENRGAARAYESAAAQVAKAHALMLDAVKLSGEGADEALT